MSAWGIGGTPPSCRPYWPVNTQSVMQKLTQLITNSFTNPSLMSTWWRCSQNSIILSCDLLSSCENTISFAKMTNDQFIYKSINNVDLAKRSLKHPLVKPISPNNNLLWKHNLLWKVNTINNQFIYKSINNVDRAKVLPSLNHPIKQPPVLLWKHNQFCKN